MSRPDWCSRVENVRGSFGAPRPLPKRAEYVPKATERRPARAIVDSNKPKSMNAPIRKITQQRVATGVDVRAARISNAATRAQKRGPHKAARSTRGASRARAAFGAPLSLDVDDAKAPAPAGDDRLVTAVDGRTVEFSGLAHESGPVSAEFRESRRKALRNAPRGKATRTITWDQLKKNYDPRDEWRSAASKNSAASKASKASLASKPSEVSIGLVDAPAEVVVDVAPGQYPTPVPTWESGGTRSRACSPTAQFAAGLRSDTPEPYEHEKTFFVEPIELERSCLDDDGRGVDDDDEPPPTPDFDYARGLQQPGTYGDEVFECCDDEDQP
ncbi:hypothetical protein JL720_10347 [Aureococcus anophagefferens]|nr:hypothetical protein JL720_10347 [Aureococcus anophagefferens]